MLGDAIQNLLLLIKLFDREEEVKTLLVNLMPVESAFDVLTNTGTILWSIFVASIDFYGMMICIALLALMVIIAICPPDSSLFLRSYGGLYTMPGLTAILPGLNKYFVDPQQRIAIWLVNVFIKPWIYIIVAEISIILTATLLVDRAFVYDMLTLLLASPFVGVGVVSTTMYWMVFILTAAAFFMVAGLFLYPVIELGNVFNLSITEWMEEMMYAALIVPPMVAFLYRIAFMMHAENSPLTATVMWVAAIAIPFLLVVFGLIKALTKLVLDVVVMYVFKGLFAKGLLSGSQLTKLSAFGGILSRARSGGSGSPHQTGLPTRLLKRSK